jgi:pimeloyl-ACP methyl ester carboxylesterase
VTLSRRELLGAGVALALGPGDAGAPEDWPGTPSSWSGHERHDFQHQGRPAIVVAPAPTAVAAGRPWLWRAEFFGAFATVDRALLARGWHVAYLDCKDTFGSPETLARWSSFHALLTGRLRLSRRPVLLGMSRGGLYAYRWAAANPDKVGLIYGDAPVCDVKSWPAGKGKGKGSAKDWLLFQKVYGLDEAQALRWTGNPIDLLAPIARARIPILHVVGDADDVVPVEENTAVLRRRYQELGGRMEVIVKKGVGHHPHSLEDPTPIVEFILARALKG